jgi:HlyD family secretion protein
MWAYPSTIPSGLCGLTTYRLDCINKVCRPDGIVSSFYPPPMNSQFLSKSSNSRVLALVIAVAALASGIGYYGVTQFGQRQEPKTKEQPTLAVQQVVALGQIEPQAEVIKVSVPATLSNDRVAQLLVERGDRVTIGQTIAILDSRDRLQGLLAEAKEQVNLAQAELAQVRAGAKTGEINSQKAEIARTQAQSLGEERTQRESLARLEAQWLGDKAVQQAAVSRLEGDKNVQAAGIKKIAAELSNARSELRRYEQLYKAGAIAQSQYDTKRLTMDTLAQQLNEAKAILIRSESTGNKQISEGKANLQRIIATGSKQISEAKAVLARIRSTSDQQVIAAQGTLSKISEVRPVDLKTAEAKVNRAIIAAKRAEIELAQAYVRSPAAGQILEIFAKPGEVVKDNGLVNLGQTNQMQVVAEVDQSNIEKIHKGQAAILKGEAFSGELRGTVHEIGLAVSRQTTFSNQPGENLDQRVVKVRIHLNPEDSKRVAGLTNLQVQVAIQP